MPETSVTFGSTSDSEGTPKTNAKKRRRAETKTVALGSIDDSNSSVPSEDNEHRAQASDSPSDDYSEYDPFGFDAGRLEFFLLPEAQSNVLSSTQQARAERDQDDTSIPSRPSVKFTRDTWWDALLAFYAFGRDPMTDTHSSATSWMSFIHLPRFFEMVLNTTRRAEMQPSLLFSALALGTLTQSSEVEKGGRGRRRAMKLLDMAHSALQSSLATGWVDIGLAQAGWLILYFEFNSHPMHAWDRLQSALSLLDSLVRLLSLTTLDTGYQHAGIGPLHATPSDECAPHTGMVSMGSFSSFAAAYTVHTSMGLPAQYGHQATQHWNPTSQTFDSVIPDPLYIRQTQYNHIEVPQALHSAGSITNMSYGTDHHQLMSQNPSRGCGCARFSLGHHWPTVREFAPSWAWTPMWPTNVPEAEFKKKECRRLIWASIYMIGSLHAFANKAPGGGVSTLRTFVKEHDSFALLTPSQTLVQAGVLMEADDVWSLTLRLMLLFHSSVRMRVNPTLPSLQRAEFAVRTWLKIDDIERRMQRHTCDMLSHYGFHSVELLLSLRVCVSYEFQRFVPQVTT
ncbi:hypothetical protein C8Q70DRAFT_1057127 [Cubamyces menziesii]|nr:hypothetical protein C8Q70DRAFT_1057127 [Cubamyces menziesii]